MAVEFTDPSGLPILRRPDLNDADLEAGHNPFTTLDDLLVSQMINPSWIVLGANITMASGDPAALMYGSRALSDTTLMIHQPGDGPVASVMTRMNWLSTTASTDLGLGISQLLEQMKSHG